MGCTAFVFLASDVGGGEICVHGKKVVVHGKKVLDIIESTIKCA